MENPNTGLLASIENMILMLSPLLIFARKCGIILVMKEAYTWKNQNLTKVHHKGFGRNCCPAKWKSKRKIEIATGLSKAFTDCYGK